jgi:hypothetical protein
VAYGELRISKRDFWKMTPREFLNGWIGYDDAKKETWDILYYNAKYNALRTAMDKKQANQIVRDKAPWKRRVRKKQMSHENIEKMLNMISK